MSKEYFRRRADADGKNSELVTVRISDSRCKLIDARLLADALESIENKENT